MAAWWSYWQKLVLPFIAMASAQIAFVGVTTLFKAANLKGMSYLAFVVYSYATGALFLLPSLFISPSRVALPLRKSPLIIRICLLGPTGVMAQLFTYKGIEYSSPTLASAMSNLLPAFTFIMATILRMERLEIRSYSTQAKIIGSLVSISGALVVVLYRGPAILSASSEIPSISLYQSLSAQQPNWIIGSVLLAIQCFLTSVWFILLGQIMRIYPAELTVIFFHNFFAAILSGVFCFVVERDLSVWRLSSKVAYAAVIYSGFFGQCFTNGIDSWCARINGPVYVASFKPLSIAIAAIMGFIVLGDALYLGSVIGAIIICIGFYAVLWGKGKEEITEQESICSLGSSSEGKMPLLQYHETDRV